MRFNLIFILLISLNSYGDASNNALSNTLSKGVWILDSTNKGHPNTMLIGEYKVTFNKDSTWSYVAKMIGKYDGMSFEGSGSWYLKGDVLEYTAGENKGKSKVVIDETVLKLSPDPVLMLNGTEPLDAIYKSAM